MLNDSTMVKWSEEQLWFILGGGQVQMGTEVHKAT